MNAAELSRIAALAHPEGSHERALEIANANYAAAEVSLMRYEGNVPQTHVWLPLRGPREHWTNGDRSSVLHRKDAFELYHIIARATSRYGTARRMYDIYDLERCELSDRSSTRWYRLVLTVAAMLRDRVEERKS